MAQGRLLSRCISLDKKLSELEVASALAFTWTIVHLDRDGRICGDPTALRSIVFPRRQDISDTDMERFITAWAVAGLVDWYEAKGDRWLSFPNFRKHQPHLRYDREAPSNIPPPEEGTPVELRTYSGPTPDLLPPKAMKSKGKKDTNVECGGVGPEPEQTPSAAVPATNGRQVYHLIEHAFTSQAQEFDFKREGPHIRRLEKKCLARDGPEEFAKAVLVTFWRLTQEGDKFWRGQPFLPSVLDSGGIWPRVLKELENMAGEQVDGRTAEIIGGLW